MSEFAPAEDERGVDVAQIRRLLAMPVAERVRYMIEVSNRMIEIQQSVGVHHRAGHG